ncbi:hypothetical protein [Thalassotalea litorea]|uniref:hypothetical protein n=1 Tax=Thalassotalea litorea TaxID=2020715 RepID=UPI0037356CF6
MKRRITKLSIHQNALMAGVLMAAATLPFMIPVFLLTMISGGAAEHGSEMPAFSGWAILVLPIIYFIFSYISAAIMCFIYNLLAPMIGGFEAEINVVD